VCEQHESAENGKTGDSGTGKGAEFDLSNLNYVKKKLFDPEIDFLRKKFKEELEEAKKDIRLEMNTTI